MCQAESLAIIGFRNGSGVIVSAASCTDVSQVRSRQDPDAAFPSGRGTKLACVELVKADKMDVVALGGL